MKHACTNVEFDYKSSPTQFPYIHDISSIISTNTLALGWTYTKTSCFESINYEIKDAGGGPAPSIF